MVVICSGELIVREIKPYRTVNGLKKSIDNGGRFYNFLTGADDEVVTRAELAKAAGVFSAGINAYLFLEMAQQDLATGDRESIITLLEPELRRNFKQNRPTCLLPSAVEKQGKAGRSLVVMGYPRFVEDKTEFNGFIMVPIVAGSVTTFTMIPIFDQFNVYEVFDDKRMRKPNSVVATTRGMKFEPGVPIRFGGILRKLSFENKTRNSHQFYLETVFYSKLQKE